MGLETYTYINSFNSSWPLASDNKSVGDDHIRGIKAAILATWPNVTGAVNATHTQMNYLNAAITADAVGTVGIGVTPTTSDVAGFVELPNGRGVLSQGTSLSLSTNSYWNGGWKYKASSTLSTKYEHTSGGHVFSTAATGTAGNAITWVDRLTIDSNGNVGIGITPFYKLHVKAATNKNLIVEGSGMLGWINDALSAYVSAEYRSSTHTFKVGSLGATTAMLMDTSGAILAVSPAGLGYGTGAGGSVTQTGASTNPVTLNKPSGAITMVAYPATPGTSITFQLNNSLIGAADVVVFSQRIGIAGTFLATACEVTNGSCYVRVHCLTAFGSEAPSFNFAIIKGTTS